MLTDAWTLTVGEEENIREKEGTVAKPTVNNYVKGQTGNRTSVVLTTDWEALVSKEANSICVEEELVKLH